MTYYESFRRSLYPSFPILFPIFYICMCVYVDIVERENIKIIKPPNYNIQIYKIDKP